MFWGEHDDNEDFSFTINQVKINTKDIEALKVYQIECEAHRKRTDEVQNQLLLANKTQSDCMLRIEAMISAAIPTVQRAQNNFTTLDTLKSWAIWITSIAAAITIIYQLLK